MNRVVFGGSACDRTRKHLDSYISNELLVEPGEEVLWHLKVCRECAAEAEARAQLRSRLRSAVRTRPVPVELPAKVREAIRTGEARKPVWAVWRWPAAAAATVAFAAVTYVGLLPEQLPSTGDRAAQDAFVQRISTRVAAVLKVGLGDHIHCAVFGKRQHAVPTVAEMEKELGPSFHGLLPVVTAASPEGYRIVTAHQCRYLKRPYVHLTLEKDGDLLSLVISRKQDGESFGGLAPAATQGGIPVYQSAAGRYQVAGFEAGPFFAWVVSDLSRNGNLRVAAAMAPGVQKVLTKTPA